MFSCSILPKTFMQVRKKNLHENYLSLFWRGCSCGTGDSKKRIERIDLEDT